MKIGQKLIFAKIDLLRRSHITSVSDDFGKKFRNTFFYLSLKGYTTDNETKDLLYL